MCNCEYFLKLSDDIGIGIFWHIPKEIVDRLIHKLFELDDIESTSNFLR